MKKYLLSIPALIAGSLVANANAMDIKDGVSFSGGAEAYVHGYTNADKNGNPTSDDTKSFSGSSEVVLNTILSGKHAIDFGNFIWSAQTKTDVSTNQTSASRFDPLGQGQIWGGIQNDKFGSFTVGRQLSEAYNTVDSFTYMDMSNLFSDYGAQSLRYGKAFRYETPSMAGLTVVAQYGAGTYDANAYDVVAHYATSDNSFVASVGYSGQRHVMDKELFTSTNFDEVSDDSNDGNGKSDADLGFAVASYTLNINADNALILTAGYKYNAISNDLVDNLKTHQALGTVGYKFGKNKVSLGYQIMTGAKGTSKLDNASIEDSNIQGIYSEYARQVADNTNVYVRARYNTWDKDKHNVITSLGGVNTDHADNATVITAGVVVGF